MHLSKTFRSRYHKKGEEKKKRHVLLDTHFRYSRFIHPSVTANKIKKSLNSFSRPARLNYSRGSFGVIVTGRGWCFTNPPRYLPQAVRPMHYSSPSIPRVVYFISIRAVTRSNRVRDDGSSVSNPAECLLHSVHRATFYPGTRRLGKAGGG